MPTPFFSVIIPTYNRYEFLKTALDSVLAQTFCDFELIIIDDGSTDKTQDLVKGINDARINYLRQPHQGVSVARNKGITLAQGKVIAFLDSDDRFKKNKLEVTYNYITKFPNIKIFHTEEIWYRHGKLLNQKHIHKKPEGLVFNTALGICCISISTAAVKKELFDKIGLFDKNLPACEDYDFWLRATAKYPVKLIPKSLTLKEGGHPDQLSKKYAAMDKFRIYSLEKLLNAGILNKTQKIAAIQELQHRCTIYIKGATKRHKEKEVKYYQNLIKKYG